MGRNAAFWNITLEYTPFYVTGYMTDRRGWSAQSWGAPSNRDQVITGHVERRHIWRKLHRVKYILVCLLSKTKKSIYMNATCCCCCWAVFLTNNSFCLALLQPIHSEGTTFRIRRLPAQPSPAPPRTCLSDVCGSKKAMKRMRVLASPCLSHIKGCGAG